MLSRRETETVDGKGRRPRTPLPAREFPAHTSGVIRFRFSLTRISPPPGIRLDLARLRAEHRERAAWMEKRLACESETDWTSIRVGARQLLGDV
ncbi:DUF5984 family protein [Amycolatopsis sp.]|uniref:DUF5984 family protein n=1 Tax=Amycolatopsis sp. TaxID=37632 RepID=UPI003458C95C